MGLSLSCLEVVAYVDDLVYIGSVQMCSHEIAPRYWRHILGGLPSGCRGQPLPLRTATGAQPCDLFHPNHVVVSLAWTVDAKRITALAQHLSNLLLWLLNVGERRIGRNHTAKGGGKATRGGIAGAWVARRRQMPQQEVERSRISRKECEKLQSGRARRANLW